MGFIDVLQDGDAGLEGFARFLHFASQFIKLLAQNVSVLLDLQRSRLLRIEDDSLLQLEDVAQLVVTLFQRLADRLDLMEAALQLRQVF